MKMNMKKLTYSAMFCALCFVATYIKVPISTGVGYVNLGDCIVLLSGWILGPLYGFFAAGIGSALCDIVSSFVIYAPATFVIKGLMATASYFIFIILSKKIKNIFAKVVSGIVAEIIMVLGYFLFELFLYGFATALADVPFNVVQGFVGLVVGVILSHALQRVKFDT